MTRERREDARVTFPSYRVASVEDLLSRCTPGIQRLVLVARRAILRAVPGSTERLRAGWGNPGIRRAPLFRLRRAAAGPRPSGVRAGRAPPRSVAAPRRERHSGAPRRGPLPGGPPPTRVPRAPARGRRGRGAGSGQAAAWSARAVPRDPVGWNRACTGSKISAVAVRNAPVEPQQTTPPTISARPSASVVAVCARRPVPCLPRRPILPRTGRTVPPRYWWGALPR